MLVAGLVASGIAPKSIDPRLAVAAGALATLTLLCAIGAFLYAAGRRRATG